MYTCEQAILDVLAARGALNGRELRTECIEQATDFNERRYIMAMHGLIVSGQITWHEDADAFERPGFN